MKAAVPIMDSFEFHAVMATNGPTIGPPGDDAFYGYGGPGRTEEFWILDVNGTRLVVEATWTPASLAEDVAGMPGILDSIRIEP